MKKEIECRLLDVNVQQFIDNLILNQATLIGDWIQKRNIYDFSPVKKNSWIRLRTNGIETTLTIKEVNNLKIDGTKECEIVVSDFATTDELLNKLGYFARSVQENRRIRFMLNGVEVDIDFWPCIPAYVEFEAESEQAIKDVCKILNVEYGTCTSVDVEGIYNHYGYLLSDLPQKLELEDKIKTQQFQY